MPWLQIKLDIIPAHAEFIEQQLLTLGACAVTLEDGADQPLFEPELGTTPLWDHTRMIGLFEADRDIKALAQDISALYAEQYPGSHAPRCKAELLEDKDWERAWMDNFHPIQFGQRLWICPSWRDTPDPAATNLLLDPGLAFGTGTHPTTALCLEWLDQVIDSQERVIDYGCGSGILGIAALLLGAKQLVATDIDPQALTATRDNAGRNRLDMTRIRLDYPSKIPQEPADLLVANILAGPLTELAPTLAELVRPGGRIALSGLLQTQTAALLEAYAPWFELNPPTLKDEWIRIDGIRR